MRTIIFDYSIKADSYLKIWLRVRLFILTKFVTAVCKIVVGSNLVAALLFTTRIAEDFVVNITSSKAKKSYS